MTKNFLPQKRQTTIAALNEKNEKELEKINSEREAIVEEFEVKTSRRIKELNSLESRHFLILDRPGFYSIDFHVRMKHQPQNSL